MSEKKLQLYIEIKNSNLIFYVVEKDDQNSLSISYKLDIPVTWLENNKILNFDNFSDSIKKNIYLVEQNQKWTFKEVILILDSVNTSFVSLSGYKN